jgi:hypothetical protein
VHADTVEALVRQQMSKTLGGRRGMAEAAVPTLVFTGVFLTTRTLWPAIYFSVGAALVLLVIRIVQRSSPQFVLNSLLGIGVGALFAWNSSRSGGSVDDTALAYFLPGILYNAGYAVVMTISNLVGWPVVGFMVGSASGEPTEWHGDADVVRLSKRLTWLLILPCVIRVAVQAPLYLAGKAAVDAGAMVAALGVSKIAMGWPLQLLSLAAMVWVLTRGRTPRTVAVETQS